MRDKQIRLWGTAQEVAALEELRKKLGQASIPNLLRLLIRKAVKSHLPPQYESLFLRVDYKEWSRKWRRTKSET